MRIVSLLPGSRLVDGTEEMAAIFHPNGEMLHRSVRRIR